MKQEDLINKYRFIKHPIECEDGWIPLIDSMCKEIKDYIHNNYPELEYDQEFYFTQIKEKYGRLTCYLTFSVGNILEIIDKYEEKSYNICEICGNDGKIREINGWYQTLCDKHYSMKLKELRDRGVNING